LKVKQMSVFMLVPVKSKCGLDTPMEREMSKKIGWIAVVTYLHFTILNSDLLFSHSRPSGSVELLLD